MERDARPCGQRYHLLVPLNIYQQLGFGCTHGSNPVGCCQGHDRTTCALRRRYYAYHRTGSVGIFRHGSAYLNASECHCLLNRTCQDFADGKNRRLYRRNLAGSWIYDADFHRKDRSTRIDKDLSRIRNIKGEEATAASSPFFMKKYDAFVTLKYYLRKRKYSSGGVFLLFIC